MGFFPHFQGEAHAIQPGGGWNFVEGFHGSNFHLRIAPEAMKLFPLANCDANMWRPGSALEVGFGKNLWETLNNEALS